MSRFIVRRSLSALALLLATSFLVFSFFELIPNYNPARAIAGRNANQTTVNQVAKKFDLDKPFYVQYANTMKLIFTGQVIDYQNDLNVVDQFRQRFPVTLSLVIPAAVIWLSVSLLLGSISALD
jgi:peptide/nickel transport system permease protein